MRYANVAWILAMAMGHVLAKDEDDMKGYYLAQRERIRARGLQSEPPSPDFSEPPSVESVSEPPSPDSVEDDEDEDEDEDEDPDPVPATKTKKKKKKSNKKKKKKKGN